MGLNDRPQIQRILRHGNGVAVTIPKRILQALGWNQHDCVNLQVVEGHLVATKVKVPASIDLRRSVDVEQG